MVLTHNDFVNDAHEVPGVDDPGGALTVLGSTRAVRRFHPDPIADALVDALVWAATRAPSPNNSQLWHFVVVRSAEQRHAIAQRLARFTKWIDSLGAPEDESDARIRASSRHLLVHLADAPLLVVVCAEHRYPADTPDLKYLWSAVNTASQNLLVAARSLGLGATLTMLHVANESGVAEVLGLPEHVRIGTMIPVGWPLVPSGPVRRRPLSEVIHHDRW